MRKKEYNLEKKKKQEMTMMRKEKEGSKIL